MITQVYRLKNVKIFIIPKVIYSNVFHILILKSFFKEIKKKQFVCNYTNTLHSQSDPQKEGTGAGDLTVGLIEDCNAFVIKAEWFWQKNRHRDQLKVPRAYAGIYFVNGIKKK